MKNDYSVTIKESSKELTAREKLKVTDIQICLPIDQKIDEHNGNLIIKPTDYVLLGVHNEKSDNKDYEVFVVIDINGDMYSTSSKSFKESFMQIFEIMREEKEEYEICCFKVESKNYKGKSFIKCSIV